jgi:four helix bundle protein
MERDCTSEFKVRIYVFVLEVLRMLKTIKPDASSKVILGQIARSSTSIIANYVEGQSGVSRKEFTNYLSISLKSSNETKLWLKLLVDLNYIDSNMYAKLSNELVQISNILGASIKKLRSAT